MDNRTASNSHNCHRLTRRQVHRHPGDMPILPHPMRVQWQLPFYMLRICKAPFTKSSVNLVQTAPVFREDFSTRISLPQQPTLKMLRTVKIDQIQSLDRPCRATQSKVEWSPSQRSLRLPLSSNGMQREAYSLIS